jgi:ABC-type uncharacterized transport system ATPase subunit
VRGIRTVTERHKRNETVASIRYWRSTGMAGKGRLIEDKEIQRWIDWLIKDGTLKPGQVRAADVCANQFNPYRDDIILDVAPGEFLILVGPSGCGKSTLLDLLGGLATPSMGSIQFDGQPITGRGPDRDIVFQQYALFPWRAPRPRTSRSGWKSRA